MIENRTMPYIAADEKGITTLYVDDKPYLVIGGELHNSSASSLEYMEEEVWPYLRELHMNTVIASVAWEDLEPEEGKYDYTLVQGLLEQARRENVRLILLWFGLWKNGESFYVPGWVKKDYNRYFRARYINHVPSETISPFCKEAVEKDKTAFEHLMAYLRDNDKERTVIMVQVENEIGFLKSERDYSEEADRYFYSQVPDEVAKDYGKSGTWSEVFGADGPENFMAYYYGKAVENIAFAGKEIYPLPLFVNAWIEQHPARPGIYPSGGPTARMIHMWKLAAPTISLCAPDIYLSEFADVCESYMTEGNPLFIPETGRSSMSASNIFYVFGKLNGMGFSPFGIEDIMKNNVTQMSSEQLAELNIAASAFYDRETSPFLKRSYEIIDNIKDLIFKYRGTDKMTAFIKRNPNEQGCILPMDSFDLQLDYIDGRPGKPGSAGIIIKEKEGFYIIGCNVRFTVLPKMESNTGIGIPRYEEGEFVNGQWKRRRILNGDEVYDFTIWDYPDCRYVGVYPHQ